MALDILTFGEAIVEVMRTGIDQPLDTAGPFEGPYPSGAPFIFTVQAARLGARAACIGTIGDDDFGRCFMRGLETDHVDTRAVRTLQGYTTGVAFIAYRGDGSRTYVFHMKHAASGQISAEQLDPALFEGLKLLHLTGSSLAMHQDALELGQRALELARQHGAKVSFDPNIRPQLIPVERAREEFMPFVEAADVLLLTPEEAAMLTGYSSTDEAIGTLIGADLKRIVVLHAGKGGCTVYTAHGSEHVPSFDVDEVDPTGAGDCFDAGFLVRWLEEASPVQAAHFANACGALAVTKRGPMAGARARAEVEAFLNER